MDGRKTLKTCLGLRNTFAVLVFLALLGLVGAANGRTITVDDDGPADFDNIQAAIDDANDGDEIVCADGIYTGAGNRDIDFLGKAITVRSENGPENCIIDCNGTRTEPHRGFNFQSGEGPNSVLTGFTIKRGAIYGSSAKGGGIYCIDSSPKIEKCIITDNKARSTSREYKRAYGGGIYIGSNSNPVIENCTIYRNTVLGCEGGKINWTGQPGGNAYGGGIFCSSSATINNCIISNNKAIGGKGGHPIAVYGNSGGDAQGGGICCSNSYIVTINNCLITGNQATGGGGDERSESPVRVNAIVML